MRILVTNIGRRIYFGKFLVDLSKKIKNLKIYLGDDNLNISGLKIKGVENVRLTRVEKSDKNYLKEHCKLQEIKKNFTDYPLHKL